jgi:hypothetical protein
MCLDTQLTKLSNTTSTLLNTIQQRNVGGIIKTPFGIYLIYPETARTMFQMRLTQLISHEVCNEVIGIPDELSNIRLFDMMKCGYLHTTNYVIDYDTQFDAKYGDIIIAYKLDLTPERWSKCRQLIKQE